MIYANNIWKPNCLKGDYGVIPQKGFWLKEDIILKTVTLDVDLSFKQYWWVS